MVTLSTWMRKSPKMQGTPADFLLSYGVMMGHDTQCQEIWSQKNIYRTRCSYTPTLPDLIYVRRSNDKKMKIQLLMPWNSPRLIEFDRSWCITQKFNITSMLLSLRFDNDIYKSHAIIIIQYLFQDLLMCHVQNTVLGPQQWANSLCMW